MDPTDDDCSFASLASKASTNSYRQLRDLIEALENKDDVSRKYLLLQYAIYTRHTFARLLAAVRWLRQHGNIIQRTTVAETSALANVQTFEDVADDLWHSNVTAHTAAAPRSAVSSAVDILTSGSLKTFPRVATSTLGIKGETPEKPIFSEVTEATEATEVTQQLGSVASPLSSSPPSIVTPRSAKPNISSLGCISPSVTERLGIATRNCIRESLLHLGKLRVVSWRSGIADVCVTVGVDPLWSAEVSLDSLDPDTAVLRVHTINLMIGSHVDAAGQSRRNHEGKVNRKGEFGPSQEAMLRRIADDRMSAALQAARSVAKSQSNVNATGVMLCSLRDMMMDDVCAPLAMDHLRAQALALSAGRWKSVIRVEDASPDTPRSMPLIIRYWQEHREPATIKITEFNSGVGTVKTEDAEQETGDVGKDHVASEDVIEGKPICIICSHEPSLPSLVELGGDGAAFELKMDNLDLEELLLSCIRLRGRARLQTLYDAFKRQSRSLRVHPSCIVLTRAKTLCPNGNSSMLHCGAAEDVLFVQLGGSDDTGVEVRVFGLTGGIRVRPYGAASLSQPVHNQKQNDLWTGTNHLSSQAEELHAVLKAFEAIRARVKLNAASRSVCGLDIGVSNTLPPGTASVAATASPDRAASQLVPPFAPIERRAPRRFLTLSPPPPARDVLAGLHGGSGSHVHRRSRGSHSMSDRSGPSKRPRLTYATTSDALVFIQESSLAGEDWYVAPRRSHPDEKASVSKVHRVAENDGNIDRYSGTASAAAAWAVTREVVERRLRRDSLVRAFFSSSVASAAQMHHLKTHDDGDLHLESASRILLKLKCEPLPVRRAELLLRGYDAWQVRLSLLPSIFDSTDVVSTSDGEQGEGNSREKGRGDGNLWSVGVACNGSQLTFTYLSANSATVCSFFRDLTRARTAAALARGVPPSRFYRVLRRSPVRIVVGIGPYNLGPNHLSIPPPTPLYTATVEYVYSKGNSGGFSLSFSPSKDTMEQLAPLIEEALDASGGQVGGILAGLLERACPIAAAAERAVRERGRGKIRFVTALRVRAVFAGVQKPTTKAGNQADASGRGQTKANGQQAGRVLHAVDIDARGGSGFVTVIDVGRATAVMIQQGLAPRSGSSGGSGSNRRKEFVSLPKWDAIVAGLTRDGHAEAQRAGSTVTLKMELLEKFLSDLVTSAGLSDST